MKKIFLICLLLCFSVFTFAQEKHRTDSLLRVLDVTKQDSTRFKILRALGDAYMYNNAGKAIQYFQQAVDAGKNLGKPIQVANSYYSIGYCYLVKADFDRSLENYLKSMRIYEKEKDSFRLSNALISIGNVYSQNNNEPQTFAYYDRAQTLIEAMKDSGQLASLISEQGIYYDRKGEFEKALVYLERTLDIATKIKDDYLIAISYSNIGLNYKKRNKTTEALGFFDISLRLLKKFGASDAEIASIYNNIAATHAQAGNFLKAKEAFDTSISLGIKSGSRGIEMENYHNLADMYGRMKDYRNQAIYLTKYYDVKDSLFTLDNNNRITQLEADYQIEKKNAEIADEQIKTGEQKYQRNIFILIACATIALLAVLALFYRKIKNDHRLLQEKNAQISRQREELQTLNQVKDRLFGIISHDLRNPLVTLRSYLSLADNPSLSAEKKAGFKLQTQQAVIQASDMLDNLLVWANMQMKNIDPAIVQVSLHDCVEDAVAAVRAQAEQKSLSIHVELPVFTALGDANILQIALRNLLTNAVKYSHLKGSIRIGSSTRNGKVELAVADKGKGMSQQQLADLQKSEVNSTKGTAGEKGSGLGIFIVKELLEKINGELRVSSVEGEGQCIYDSLATRVIPQLWRKSTTYARNVEIARLICSF
ncbi:MAG: hypothetical protein JWQ27_1560 [Ferruginibacter sp.]|nr:hypothetical protein [Ferruginibacter sp.]